MEYSDVFEKWKNKNITSVEDLDTALDKFRVLFAYHSNVMSF